MAFDYEMKYKTYENTLSNLKSYLEANDITNGLYYLDKAINLSFELYTNSEIDEFKNRFGAENKKLKLIKTSIKEKNINPYLKNKKTIEVNSNNQKDVADSNSNELHFFKKESPKITLEDVAGLYDVKKEIKLNVLLPMQNPELYHKYKDTVGSQILMYGPPGCGKSFVAEAIAGELKCAYAIINVYDILDKYVGEAPKKIKQIFDEANQFDNCLLFFDELDTLFSSRESSDSEHTKDILNSFLTCLSGFQTNERKGIRVIIGATNRPWILDSALVRGKRFDTHIYVSLPDYDARLFLVKRAFKNHMELLANTDVAIEELTEMFDGYSCADIETIIDKTKVLALEEAVKLASTSSNVEVVPITKKMVSDVLSNYKNSVSKDMLMRFEMFKKGEI